MLLYSQMLAWQEEWSCRCLHSKWSQGCSWDSGAELSLWSVELHCRQTTGCRLFCISLCSQTEKHLMISRSINIPVSFHRDWLSGPGALWEQMLRTHSPTLSNRRHNLEIKPTRMWAISGSRTFNDTEKGFQFSLQSDPGEEGKKTQCMTSHRGQKCKYRAVTLSDLLGSEPAPSRMEQRQSRAIHAGMKANAGSFGLEESQSGGSVSRSELLRAG